nr:hypothetical protein [Candidatus Njordarchaeota archaeon]
MGFLRFLAGSFGKLLGALLLLISIFGFLGSAYIAQHYGGTTEQYMIASVVIFILAVVVIAAGKYAQKTS